MLISLKAHLIRECTSIFNAIKMVKTWILFPMIVDLLLAHHKIAFASCLSKTCMGLLEFKLGAVCCMWYGNVVSVDFVFPFIGQSSLHFKSGELWFLASVLSLPYTATLNSQVGHCF